MASKLTGPKVPKITISGNNVKGLLQASSKDEDDRRIYDLWQPASGSKL